MAILQFPNKKQSFDQLAHYFSFDEQEMVLQSLFQDCVNMPDEQCVRIYCELALALEKFDDIVQLFEKIAPTIAHDYYNDTFDEMYFTALLQTYQTEQLQTILTTKRRNYSTQNRSTTILDTFEERLNSIEQQLQDDLYAEQQTIIQTAETIATLPYFKQHAFIPQLNVLTDDSFIQVVEQLLLAPHLHPMLKGHLVESLVTRGCQKSIPMYWYGAIKTVHLNVVKPVFETPFVKAIEEIATTIDNGSLFEQNAILYMVNVYPFEQDVFESGQQLFDSMIKKHHNQLDTLPETLQQWLTTIESEIAKTVI